MPPIRVGPDDLRAAVAAARTLGNAASLRRLERQQPDLTELLLETAGELNAQLTRHDLPRPLVRRLTRRIERLGVVLVEAVCLAHQRQPRLPTLLIPPLPRQRPSSSLGDPSCP